MAEVDRGPESLELPGAGTLERCEDCHAAFGAAGRRDAHERVLLDLGEARVVAGASGGGPVYRTAEGAYIVPTGALFVRFRAGEEARAHAADLARAGFEIVDVPGYAPQAAWVRARAGGTAAALRAIAALGALPGVEHVEPELLREKRRR